MTPTQARLHAEHKARVARLWTVPPEQRGSKGAPKKPPVPAPVTDFGLYRLVRQAERIADGRGDPDALPARHKPPAFARIAHEVAYFYGLSVMDLHSVRRQQLCVDARHVAMWLGRRLTALSLAQIGRELGGRDHTTIIYGIRRVDAARQHDERLRDELQILTVRLHNGRA